MEEISSASQTSPTNTNILDYLFFLRPMLHPPVWTIIILGYYFVPSGSVSVANLALLLIVSSAAAGWAYIVNQISDIESDRINNKLRYLPLGIISKRAACIMAGLALCMTLTGAFFLGRIVGIMFTIGLSLGYVYSGRPFFMMNRPLSGLLINGIAHGILPFLAGYIVAGGGLRSGIFFSFSYFFAVAAVFIGTTIADIEGDSRSGKITPVVALGPRLAIVTMTICLVASLILARINHDLPLTTAAGLSLPFYFIATIKSNKRMAIFSIKISILLLSFAACLRFWPYVIILVIVIAGTRVYYLKRFGLSYPNLT
jgi:4-hydroxybenzoate polyprenyltransferase